MQVFINLKIIIFWKIENLEDQTFLKFQKIEAWIDWQLQLLEDRRPRSSKFNLYLRESIKGVNIRDCIHYIKQYTKFNSTNYISLKISCEQFGMHSGTVSTFHLFLFLKNI